MTDDGVVPPESAFAALGNELRLAILRELASAQREEAVPLPFSAVYDRVDVDSSSQFAYHLDRLTPVFVRQDADGYRLTHAGDRVVRAILSGTYTGRPTFEPTTVEGACPSCEASSLVARYEDPALRVGCGDCGTTVATYDFSPAEAVDRTPMEALRSCDRRTRDQYATALDGTCPACSGLADVDVVDRDGPGGSTVSAVAACRRCHFRVFAPVEVRLLSHPGVIAFLWEHGVDATDIPFWRIASVIDSWTTVVERRRPFRARVVVRCDHDELTVTLDEALRVTLDPG